MARRPHQKNTANLSGQGVGRGDATSSGLACQAEVRGPEPARRLAGQTRPSAFPLRDGRIGAGEVVNDRLRREPLGLSSGRRLSRADLPDHHRPFDHGDDLHPPVAACTHGGIYLRTGDVGSEASGLGNHEVTRNSFDAVVDSLRREIAHLEKATAL